MALRVSHIGGDCPREEDLVLIIIHSYLPAHCCMALRHLLPCRVQPAQLLVYTTAATAAMASHFGLRVSECNTADCAKQQDARDAATTWHAQLCAVQPLQASAGGASLNPRGGQHLQAG